MKKLSLAEKLAFLVSVLYIADLFGRAAGWYELLLTAIIVVMLVILVMKAVKK